ncbi:hypothetical protein GCM10028857_07160 [Salinarchaeum chitinilyticum]
MSDDEKESDSVGPDIDLEKIANESDADDDAAAAESSDAADHHDGGHGHDDGHDDQHDSEPAGRTTAPQSDFTARQAAIGGIVTAIGLVVAYAVPALLA